MLPKTIKLLGHTITVRGRKDLWEECECWGRWTIGKMLIEVDTSCVESMQEHTLWHEIMHAAFELTGYNEHSKDETLVDALGGALAQVYKSLEKK